MKSYLEPLYWGLFVIWQCTGDAKCLVLILRVMEGHWGKRNMEWSDFMEDQMDKSISCRINFGVESCILSQENIDRVHKIDHS